MTREAGPAAPTGGSPSAAVSFVTAPWGAMALACAAASAGAFCLPVANPDIFWHLSAARWMAEHRALPRFDWLSHTMAGAPWSDFEWLSQLLFFAAFKLCGFAGLWLLKGALYGAGAWLLWGILGRYRAGALARGIGVLAWSLAVSPANDLRPENFSLLFFLLVWSVLESRRLKRPGAGFRTGRRAAAVAALFALWANLHAGFLYGLVLLGIFAAADALARRDWELSRLAVIAAAAALLNPYGIGVYRVPFEHWAELPVLERYIREWQEASVLSPWLWPFWAVLAAAFAAALARYLAQRDVPPEHLAALCLFGLSGAAHVRTGVYFSSVAVPIAAAALCGFRALERSEARGILAAAALAGAWLFVARFIAPPLSQFHVFRDAFVPVRLSDFLERERRTLGGLDMLNPWHWGGYLGYRLQPDYKVFVDGRYLFHSLLKPMYEALRTPESYAEFLDGRGIELAVLERNGQVQPMRVELEGEESKIILRPFYLFFLPRENWALVYWDERGLVFARRSAVPEDWLKLREFVHFRPGDLEAAALAVRAKFARPEAVAAEARRHAALLGEPLSREARDWLDALGT